jgi:1-acyl-sn-glycerol-3-phosphate acyltransferase
MRPSAQMRRIGTKLRALYRMLRLIFHLFYGWFLVQTFFRFCSQAQKMSTVRRWGRSMLALMGVSWRISGIAPQSGPLLLVSNHVSWLDVMVLHVACYGRYVAKSEIKSWPVFGRIAQGIDTLFIERSSRRDAHRVVTDMRQALEQGGIMVVFPEGTTSDGLQVLPFHANLFQAAIDAQCPVQAVALRYRDTVTGQTSLAPSYIGDETLLTSLWRTLQCRRLGVDIRFGVPVDASHAARKALSQGLQQEVARLHSAAHNH